MSVMKGPRNFAGAAISEPPPATPNTLENPRAVDVPKDLNPRPLA